MRVVFVSPGLLRFPPTKGGGVEAQMFGISKALARVGVDVTVLDSLRTKDLPEEEIEGVKIRRLQSVRIDRPQMRNNVVNKIVNENLFALRVMWALSALAPDILHMQTAYVGCHVARSADRGLKVVYTCQNGLWNEDHVGWFEKLIVRKVEGDAMKLSDRVITGTETLRENLVEKVPLREDEVEVIPSGVDTSYFRPNLPCDDLRRRYRLEGYRVVLFAGRMIPAKGLEYLVTAMNMIVNKMKHDSVKCVIAGPGGTFGSEAQSSYAQRIRNLVHDACLDQHIVFTGSISRDEVRRLYSASDLFVLPSIYEGMPNVLVEAMACGKPVISTETAGLPDSVKRLIGGQLVRPRDASQLAERIHNLLASDQERNSLGKKLRQFAESALDWSVVAKRTCEMYRSL